VAARLQDMTKTLDCKAIVSDEVFATAGVTPGQLARTEVAVRGREEPMIVRTVADPAVLASMLKSASALAPAGAS
jgi:adenylate cyclase